MSVSGAPAQAFFLKTAPGQRFCLYHPADPAAGACRGALLYLHPFGDEMNKARRMAALQARELAALGYGVLQIDLYGCGDSSGDFADARWEIWQDDVARARAWLGERTGCDVMLWGLRVGALLALDCARALTPAGLILWQPLASGSAFLTQFLRLRVANGILAEGGADAGGTKALRAQLRAGELLEVAGYALAPAMADALDALDAGKLAVRGCPVHWFEVNAAADRPLNPAGARLAADWERQDVALRVHLVHCQQFWATQEITECPPLLAATASALREVAHAV